MELHVLFINHLLILIWWICLPAKTSGLYFKDTLRNESKNFHSSKLCFLWLVYTLTPSNFTHKYLTSANLPFNTETTKKFRAEKKLRRIYDVLRHLTKYSCWIYQVSSASKDLRLRFESILAIGRFVNYRHLWFLCGTITEEQSASKTEKKIDQRNVFSHKRWSVAVNPRGLRA